MNFCIGRKLGPILVVKPPILNVLDLSHAANSNLTPIRLDLPTPIHFNANDGPPDGP